MNPIVHFEIPTDDGDRAEAFYAKAFGWQIQSMPGGGYRLCTTTPMGADHRPSAPGAINGGMLERSDTHKSPILVLQVDDVEAALARIGEHGGETVLAPQQVGDMGIAAYFKDSEGNVLGLWQPLGR